jgi:uncharacterized protein (DUF1810 family)
LSDTFDLARFVRAQEPVIARVLDELAGGRKTSHWMWFVFPQLAGLGRSATAQRYAISGLEEARAYLAHPVLGPRLRTCTQAVLNVEGRSAHDIFGNPDDMKFRSSMTLFAAAAVKEKLFRLALQKYFGSEADAPTLGKLS